MTKPKLFKTNNKYVKIATIGLICIFLLLLILFTLEKTGVTHFWESAKLSESKKEAANVDAANKKALTEQDNPSTNINVTPPTNYSPPSNADNIVILASQNGNNITISTKLYSYSDGTCDLNITNGTRSDSQTAKVLYQPQFSTCAGFVVPTSRLGLGTWNLKLTVTSGGISVVQKKSIEVR